MQLVGAADTHSSFETHFRRPFKYTQSRNLSGRRPALGSGWGTSGSWPTMLVIQQNFPRKCLFHGQYEQKRMREGASVTNYCHRKAKPGEEEWSHGSDMVWETMEDVLQLRPGDQGNDSVRSLRGLGKMKDAKGNMVPISPHSHQLYDRMWRRCQVDVYEVPLTRRNLVLARYVHSTPLRCPTRSPL